MEYFHLHPHIAVVGRLTPSKKMETKKFTNRSRSNTSNWTSTLDTTPPPTPFQPLNPSSTPGPSSTPTPTPSLLRYQHQLKPPFLFYPTPVPTPAVILSPTLSPTPIPAITPAPALASTQLHPLLQYHVNPPPHLPIHQNYQQFHPASDRTPVPTQHQH
jgi:hypothetical protein